jgi:hypothetical protein
MPRFSEESIEGQVSCAPGPPEIGERCPRTVSKSFTQE